MRKSAPSYEHQYKKICALEQVRVSLSTTGEREGWRAGRGCNWGVWIWFHDGGRIHDSPHSRILSPSLGLESQHLDLCQ